MYFFGVFLLVIFSKVDANDLGAEDFESVSQASSILSHQFFIDASWLSFKLESVVSSQCSRNQAVKDDQNKIRIYKG